MGAATNETDRVCPECGKAFRGKGARKSCGDLCAAMRMHRQQAEHAAARRREAWKPEPKACRECNSMFVPYSSGHVICTALACKAQALAKSVQSQKERRRAKHASTLGAEVTDLQGVDAAAG